MGWCRVREREAPFPGSCNAVSKQYMIALFAKLDIPGRDEREKQGRVEGVEPAAAMDSARDGGLHSRRCAEGLEADAGLS